MKTKSLFKKIITLTVMFSMILGIFTVGSKTVSAEDSVDVELKATKVLDGGTLEADQFTFKIEAITEGAPMPEKTEAKNDAEGNVSFGSATYTAEGTYEYKVTEVDGGDSSITYDKEEKMITVTVSKQTQSLSSDYPNSEAGKTKTEQQLVELSVGNSDEGTNVTVDYTHGDMLGGVGDYTSYKTVTGPEGSYHPFCGAYYASAEDDPTESWNKRNRYGFRDSNGGGGLWLDAVLQFYQYNENATHFIKSRIAKPEDDHAPKRDKYGKGIETIFLNGYPHNAANLQGDMSTEEFYQLTQSVIFTFSRYAGDYKTADQLPEIIGGGRDINKEVFDKLYNGAANNVWDYGLADPVVDNGDGTYGSKIDIYVHWLNEGTAGFPQPLLSSYLKDGVAEKLTAKAEPVEFKNTVNSVIDNGPTVATKVNPSEIEAATNQRFVDTVYLSGLIKGVEYTITGTLMDKDTQSEVEAIAEPLTFVATAESEEKEIEFKLDASKLAGKSVVIFETLSWSVNGETKSVTHGDYDDTDQTVNVKKVEEE
ncbi:MAG: VaFE repeat-containing surface-anchored protein, partial [Methanobrevibacter sp.]|nr:VaFE repeat-containing surface-anchored protein [Methanobrevibacter sp.]